MKIKTSKKSVKTKQAEQKTKIKPKISPRISARNSPKNSSSKKLTTELTKMRRRVAALETVKSEHKAIEEALKETEISLRAVLSSMDDLVFVLDKESRFVFFHTLHKKNLYLPPHKFMGKKHKDVMPSCLNKLIVQAVKRNKKGKTDEYEYPLEINKQKRWFCAKLSPIFIEGKYHGSVAVVRDITNEKETKVILQKSEEEFRLLFENSKDAIFWADTKTGVIIKCNKVAEILLDKKREEIIGTHQTTLHPPRIKQYTKQFKEHTKKEKIMDDEAEVITKSGKIIPVTITASMVSLDDKSIIQGIFRDITEQKKAEKSLKETSTQWQLTFDSVKDIIMLLDNDFNIIRVNKAARKMLGLKDKDIIGKKCYHLFHKTKFPINMCPLKRAKQSKKHEEMELYIKESQTWLSACVDPILDEKGKVTGAVHIIRDITRYKQVEAISRESEQNYRATIDSMADAIHVVDENLHFILFNKTFKRWNKTLGLETNALGKKIFEVFPFLPKQVHKEYRKVFRTGKTVITCERNKPGKKEIITETRKIPIYEKGKVVRVLTVIRDVTEQKTLEEELKKSLAQTKELMEEIVEAMAMAVEQRDPETAGHQQRTARLAGAIAKEMGYSKEGITTVYWAALIHDIGKIHVPAEILNKPGALNKKEFKIVKTHSRASRDILKPIKFPAKIAQIVFQHHEKMNGSGYPRGITGKKILPEARILTVADVVEAMTSDRPYRKALSLETALKEVSKNKGILYDADVVDTCLKLFRKNKFKLA